MPADTDTFIANLVDDLAPVRPLHLRIGMAQATIALFAGAAGMAALFGPRADFLAGRPDPLALLSLGLFLVLALASAMAVVDMARPFVGSRRDGWVWNALMAGMLPLSALLLIVANLMRGAASGVHFDGANCMQYGLLWGGLTAAALTLWLRRGAPAEPNRAGFLTGVAAGSAGIFAVSLYCPHNEVIHIGLWHGATVAIAGVIGRLIVPRLVRW
jgi:hypothetical protein